MSTDKPGQTNDWRKYAKDIILLAAAVAAIATLFSYLKPTFPYFAPYVWSAVAFLFITILLIFYVGAWYHSRLLETKTHTFLLMASYLIFLFSLNAKALAAHLKAVHAEGYDKPLTFPLALGFIALIATIQFILLIWLLRFYWDAQVRLTLMQDILLDKLGVDLNKERRKYFASTRWVMSRTQRIDLLRLIAPDDLSYLQPGPPTVDPE